MSDLREKIKQVFDSQELYVYTFADFEKIKKEVLEILVVEEEIGGGKMVKVKIVCHCCDGKGKIAEKEHPSRKQIMTVCPECNGDGWVWTEK